MFGLVVSSIAAASAERTNQKTELIMIERGSSRRTAETRIRNKVAQTSKKEKDKEGDPNSQQGSTPTSSTDDGEESAFSFNPNNIKYRRIRCDLLNLHMPAILQQQAVKQHPKVSILAKHLCGHASDLALRSLLPIANSLQGLSFAMCCHGICKWEELVGRRYIEDLCVDGGVDFELLRKWGAGVAGVGEDGKEVDDEEHGNSQKEGQDEETSSSSSYTGASQVCQSPELKDLGITRNELCRISCRVIDYCRLKYVQNELGFGDRSSSDGGLKATTPKSGAEMLYYCKQSVTPQNLLIIASRNVIDDGEESEEGSGKRFKR
jgi:tRNA:m4X modification enzyme